MVPQLAAMQPDIGAYTNEANATEPGWPSLFWGSNFRSKWDPAGLFRCKRCVGSERICPANATTNYVRRSYELNRCIGRMARPIGLLISSVTFAALFWVFNAVQTID